MINSYSARASAISLGDNLIGACRGSRVAGRGSRVAGKLSWVGVNCHGSRKLSRV